MENFKFDTRKDAPQREYFSGANARVYFGDIWVDQLESLEFQLDETVAPIYGFHSYVFDKIARGQRIVNGQFTLNFTETGYLQTILDRLSSKIDRGNQNLLWGDAREKLEVDVRRNDSTRNIENILALSKDGTYDDYIEGLKSTFWGQKPQGENTVNKTGGQRESDTHFYPDADKEFGNNLLKTHGFNILIDFSPSANVRDFEDCIKDANKTGSVYQTFRTIMGVHIVNERQEMAPDGRALKITYTFVARDLDGNPSELSMKHNTMYDSNRIYRDKVYAKTYPPSKPKGRENIADNRGIEHLRP